MIKPEKKANISAKILDSIFYIWPTISVALILVLMEKKFNTILKTSDRTIEATCSATWIALGFAAAVFLIGIPKNATLKKLEKKGIFQDYVKVILLPAIIGTVHLLILIYQPVPCTKLQTFIQQTLFLSTIAQSLWSLRILFIIVNKSHEL